MTMETKKTHIKNKGGRPKKDIKKDQFLAIKCSLIERKVIEANAKMTNLTLSEYLREIGLTGKIKRQEKIFPKEILQLTGTLNHLAANLNQIAKKRNGIEQMDAFERASLEVQSQDLKRLAEEIKNYLK